MHSVAVTVTGYCGVPESSPILAADINDNLEALGRGDVVGRAVIVFD